MRWLLVVFAVVGLSGCSGRCLDRSGQYAVQMVQRTGGTCAQVFNSVANGDTLGSASVGCNFPPTTSANNCSITVDQTCQFSSGPRTTRGTINWSGDGTKGTGVYAISFEGNSPCFGTYDVTFTKL